MDILKQINKEISDFQSKEIQIVPGFYYNQYATLKSIFFYFNSQFLTGETDDEGDRKYFYNIVRNPCKVFTKAVDFDTKNIQLLTAGGGDPLKTWFMERDLKYWMRDQQFGKVLNRIFYELPIYGSVVIKIIDGKPFFVDLRNFISEQGADDLDNSSHKIEIHNYTPAEFRKIGKQMKWKESDIKEVIRLFHQMKDRSHIRIYERYGEIGDEKGNYTYRRIFWADVGIDTYNEQGILFATYPGVEMGNEEWKDHPYREFHKDKIPGRWLGVGIVEELFEPQIKENEIANLQSKGAYWTALRIWQTRDTGFNKNFSTGVKNGDVITAEQEITPVDMTDRNLAFFGEETEKWLRNRDELTIAYAPVGKSAQAAENAQQQVISYFQQIQENIALDVKEMLYDVIIPQFEKENTTEHTLRLVGQDLDTYIAMCKNDLVMKEIIRQAVSGLAFPTNHDRDVIGVAIEQTIKQGKEKILTIPKNFYKDVKYDVDIDITSESIDTKARYATRLAILQSITADPTMLTDPTKKKILAGMAEDGGISPSELFGADSPKLEDITGQSMPTPSPFAGAGGGVSAPSATGQLAGATKTM